MSWLKLVAQFKDVLTMTSKKFTYIQTQPTAEDRKHVEHLIEVVAEAMDEQGSRPLELNNLPIKRPALLFAAFDLFLDIYEDFKTDEESFEHTLNMGLVLVSHLLYELRLAIENGEKKAVTVWERFQAYMGDKLFSGADAPDSLLIFNLMQMLQQSGLPVGDKLTERFQDTMAMHAPAADMDMDISELDGLMGDLLDEEGAKTPFDLYNLLLAQLNMMPAEAMAIIFAHLAQHDNPIVSEMAFLMLLHPQQELRQDLGEALLSQHMPKTVSPVSLRRLIGMRNWLPQDERPLLDAIIKDARTNGVECAQIPAAPKKLQCYASNIDGAGAQTLWIHYTEKHKHHLLGFLAKQGFGLREVMVYQDISKQQVDMIIKQFSWEIGMIPVKAELIDFLLPHYLAVNLENNVPPPPDLLQLAEALGQDYWRAQYYSPTNLISLLEAPQTADDFADLEEEALEDSADWLDDYSWAGSWFESGEMVEELLEEHVGKNWRRSRKKSPQAILHHQLAAKRNLWTERVLMTALWQKCAEEPEDWQSCLIVGKKLADPSVPLERIPLMTAIANLSFDMLLEAQ
jgi:hypothetical protein